jgi:predicted O-methyltransferase YrrM
MERWYPAKIAAGTQENTSQVLAHKVVGARGQLLEQVFAGVDKAALRIAEFGIWQGTSSAELANFLGGQGELHLFDFEDNVQQVKAQLNAAGHGNVFAWGCSYRHLDSYNWPLRRLMQDQPDLRFDYVYLDGAHTWAVDALTFFLCDALLNIGGCIEFDDYEWQLRGSSLDPARVPTIGQQYTEEQIDDHQVKAIVDLLVRRKGSYREIRKNRVFQKMIP